MVAIPEGFAVGLVNEFGDAGRAWIDDLPRIVASLCARWGLVVDGAPMHGYLGLVVPVRRGREVAALKVSWIDESTVHEAAALAAWGGRGAVRLLEMAPEVGAMLLERLDHRRSLSGVEVGKAILVDGDLVRRLAIPAPEGLPLLADVAARLARTLPERWERLNRPMPRALVDRACDLAARLGPVARPLLVDHDLHDDNVLAGVREPWLAIDPKVVVGDPESGIAQLLWTRLEELNRAGGLAYHFDALVDRAGLDPRLARAWTLVRCVDYWLWALGVGLTEDPARCEAIATWLTSGAPLP